MKTVIVAGFALTALCGCAQTMNLAGNPAEQQCGSLARADGLRVNQTMAPTGAGDTQNVRLQLEDALGRRFEATCVYSAASGARWSTPLPTNAARR